jgi:hypothetical protein
LAELALDDIQRYALAGELHRMSMTQLVWREPTSHPCLAGEPTKLDAHGST